MKILYCLSIFIILSSACVKRELVYAKAELNKALANPQKTFWNYKNYKIDTINTKDEAINFAEPILFETYGRKNTIISCL